VRSSSCIIHGEAVACSEDSIASLERSRYRRNDRRVFLYAFDLIELDGKDLRREPIEHRKARQAPASRQTWPGAQRAHQRA
jgi:bifunctional non-homologous end joining protein LigD